MIMTALINEALVRGIEVELCSISRRK